MKKENKFKQITERHNLLILLVYCAHCFPCNNIGKFFLCFERVRVSRRVNTLLDARTPHGFPIAILSLINNRIKINILNKSVKHC